MCFISVELFPYFFRYSFPIIFPILSLLSVFLSFHFTLISPIDLLDIDYSYQRVRTAHVNELYDEWSDDECDYLWTSYRDGKFYITGVVV